MCASKRMGECTHVNTSVRVCVRARVCACVRVKGHLCATHYVRTRQRGERGRGGWEGEGPSSLSFFLGFHSLPPSSPLFPPLPVSVRWLYLPLATPVGHLTLLADLTQTDNTTDNTVGLKNPETPK